MATSTAEKMQIKLVVDNKANKVLFAEAGKDFVDLLIGFLALPLSSVRVLASDKMAGSLGELYESVGKLDDIYIQSSVDMANTLKPTPTFSIIRPTPPPSITYKPKYYTCPTSSNCSSQRITSIYNTICPTCSNGMWKEISHVNAGTELAEVVKSKNIGFVERAGTYMVMDDLEVKPLSNIYSSLNKLKDHDFSFVKEQAIDIGKEEILELLRVSMQSKTVLSDVFFCKNSTTPGVLQMKRDQVCRIGTTLRRRPA